MPAEKIGVFKPETKQDYYPEISANELHLYLDTLPSRVYKNPLAWQHRPYRDITCKQMPSSGVFLLSASSASNPERSDEEVERDFRKAMQATAGREITQIFTDLVRDHMNHHQTKTSKPVNSAIGSRVGMHKKDIEIYNFATSRVVDGKEFRLSDIPKVAFDIWKVLKEFYYLSPNQKVDRDTLAWDLHMRAEQLAVEEAVNGIHSLAVKRYLEQDLFGLTREYLPLETNLAYTLESNVPYRYQVFYLDSGIQHIGRSDWVLHHANRERKLRVIIQQKYTPDDDTTSTAKRLEVLIRSVGVANELSANLTDTRVSPQGVVYLEQVYDYAKARYYYRDVSIGVDEFPELMEGMKLSADEWIEKNDLYRSIIATRKKEAVFPELQLPAEA